MARVTVLGAGFMGAALAVHAAGRGHDVRLWGSRLDEDLLAAVRAGRPHPRLELAVPPAVRLHGADELAAATAGADAVIVAVSSDAVGPVLAEAAGTGALGDGVPVICASKGFVEAAGRIVRVSVAARAAVAETMASAEPARLLPWVALGGPAKAKELCRGMPTAVVAASASAEARATARAALEGGGLWVNESDDLAGVEVSSAFKNAYATSAGLVDGLAAGGWAAAAGGAHNTKAALFTMAAVEIATMVETLGGRAETAWGLAGVGDLHVTCVGGRNHEYGARVGGGQAPDEVAAVMRAARTLTEGYGAIATGWRLLGELVRTGRARSEAFPLLEALHRIVYRGESALEVLSGLPLRVSAA